VCVCVFFFFFFFSLNLIFPFSFFVNCRPALISKLLYCSRTTTPSLECARLIPFFLCLRPSCHPFSLLAPQDGSTELGFAEFFLFVVVIKQIEAKCVNEPDYARRTFSNLSNRFISKEEEEAEAAKTETV